MLSNAETIDLENATNEFVFPEEVTPAGAPQIDTIRRIAARGDDLYLICTSQEITNLNPKRWYAKPSKAVIDRLDSCSAKYFDVTETKFTDVFRILTSFAEWRVAANGRTFVILSPPPFKYMAAWERAFATVGVVVAWVEDGEYSPSAYSLAPDIKKRVVIDVESKDETYQVEQLLPGQKVAFWRLPGKSKKEIDNIRARMRRICLRVEQKFQDRRFATIIRPEHKQWAYVYRLSVDEYDDWCGFLPYELAVLQYHGGKTATQELNQTLEA